MSPDEDVRGARCFSTHDTGRFARVGQEQSAGSDKLCEIRPFVS